jgi:hypothetical protein
MKNGYLPTVIIAYCTADCVHGVSANVKPKAARELIQPTGQRQVLANIDGFSLDVQSRKVAQWLPT